MLYDVAEMKICIEQAISVAELTVREKFIAAFRKIYQENEVPNSFDDKVKISITKLSQPNDIENIISGSGFYIILTDLEISGNECTLIKNRTKAIYRGESCTVKKRIQSHLFNSSYKRDYKERETAYLSKDQNKDKEYYEQFWPACLKLGNGTNGINIDQNYQDNEWYVVVHSMKGSSQEVRVQAELAFDEVFKKPVASRENT